MGNCLFLIFSSLSLDGLKLFSISQAGNFFFLKEQNHPIPLTTVHPVIISVRERQTPDTYLFFLLDRRLKWHYAWHCCSYPRAKGRSLLKIRWTQGKEHKLWDVKLLRNGVASLLMSYLSISWSKMMWCSTLSRYQKIIPGRGSRTGVGGNVLIVKFGLMSKK